MRAYKLVDHTYVKGDKADPDTMSRRSLKQGEAATPDGAPTTSLPPPSYSSAPAPIDQKSSILTRLGGELPYSISAEPLLSEKETDGFWQRMAVPGRLDTLRSSIRIAGLYVHAARAGRHDVWSASLTPVIETNIQDVLRLRLEAEKLLASLTTSKPEATVKLSEAAAQCERKYTEWYKEMRSHKPQASQWESGFFPKARAFAESVKNLTGQMISHRSLEGETAASSRPSKKKKDRGKRGSKPQRSAGFSSLGRLEEMRFQEEEKEDY